MNLETLLEIDQKVTERIRIAEKPGPLRTLAVLLGHSGDSWYWALVLILVTLLAQPVYQRWAIVNLAAVVVAAVLVLTIKFTIRRKRPEGEMGQIYRKTDPHSFPSGHATRSMMLGVIALGIAPPWLGALLIVWAPLVGLARIAIGVHYISDVLAGWILGIIFGLATIQIYAYLLTML